MQFRGLGDPSGLKLCELLHSKGNQKQNKKRTLRMGENICKPSNCQKINLQNIQRARADQYKNKQLIPKNGWKI